jgi:hypothetical protein
MTEQSKARNNFCRSNTGVMGSNPIRRLLCTLFSVFVLLCVCRGLATGSSLVQGVLSTVSQNPLCSEYKSTILNLSSRWKWLASCPPRPLYPRGWKPSTHFIGGWVGPKGLSGRTLSNSISETLLNSVSRPELASRGPDIEHQVK